MGEWDESKLKFQPVQSKGNKCTISRSGKDRALEY